MSGAVNAASPSTYTDSGMPMLPALENPALSAPITDSGTSRRQASIAMARNSVMFARAMMSKITNSEENSRARSASARMLNSRHGIITDTISRDRSRSALALSSLARPTA